jgi:hypothetical protein
LTSGNKVTGTGASRDVMREFRDEVQEISAKIAQEYIAMFPLAPEHESPSAKEMDHRKSQFLYQISSSGIYHLLKEKLKPKGKKTWKPTPNPTT